MDAGLNNVPPQPKKLKSTLKTPGNKEGATPKKTRGRNVVRFKGNHKIHETYTSREYEGGADAVSDEDFYDKQEVSMEEVEELKSLASERLQDPEHSDKATEFKQSATKVQISEDEKAEELEEWIAKKRTKKGIDPTKDLEVAYAQGQIMHEEAVAQEKVMPHEADMPHEEFPIAPIESRYYANKTDLSQLNYEETARDYKTALASFERSTKNSSQKNKIKKLIQELIKALDAGQEQQNLQQTQASIRLILFQNQKLLINILNKGNSSKSQNKTTYNRLKEFEAFLDLRLGVSIRQILGSKYPKDPIRSFKPEPTSPPFSTTASTNDTVPFGGDGFKLPESSRFRRELTRRSTVHRSSQNTARGSRAPLSDIFSFFNPFNIDAHIQLPR